jgi:CheY-like chemotaxis protein
MIAEGSNITLLWSDDDCPAVLSRRVNQTIFSIDEFKLGLQLADCYIISAELTWEGHAKSDFYGFKIAQELRTNQELLCPIIMVSFLSRSYFQSDPHFKLISGRGTYFLQIPFGLNELTKVINGANPLTLASLMDLKYLLLSPRHIIDSFTHGIRFELKKPALLQTIQQIFEQAQKKIQEDSGIQDLLKELITEDVSEQRFYFIKKQVVLTLNMQLGIHTNSHPSNNRHKILLLEDNPYDAAKITQALSPHFIVVTVNKAMEAIELINDDKINLFHALFCDWRLYEGDSDQQQDWQGYEVMEYASKNRYYAMFSLTSFDEDSRKYITPYLSFSYTPLSKDFEKGGLLWDNYIPIIRQKIQENLRKLSNHPTGEAWRKEERKDYKKGVSSDLSFSKTRIISLHDQYLEIRNSLAFSKWVDEVNTYSSKIWEYYQRSLSPQRDRSLQGIDNKWGIELSHNIRNVLIIRRLFLALWYKQSDLEITIRLENDSTINVIENPVINIYSVLRCRYWNNEEIRSNLDSQNHYNKLNSGAKAFVSKLAIEPRKLPSGVLPEEQSWLNTIGIDILTGNDIDYYN